MAVCALFGHRELFENINATLWRTLEELVCTYAVDTFYVGHQGAFDGVALRALRELARRHPHIRYTVVLAYFPPPAHLANGPTVFPEGIEEVPPRYAISFRNKWMLSRADMVLVYQRHSLGGTAQMAARALRAGKTVINIATKK